jgi:ankyrin repeat protein
MESESEPEELEAEIEDKKGEEGLSPDISSNLVNTSSVLVPIFAILIIFTIGGLLLAAYISFQRSSARTELQEKNIQLTQTEFIKTVKTGDVETVERFLKAGFSPLERNIRGENALGASIERGNLKIVELLLKELGKIVEDPSIGVPVKGDRSITSLIETECKGQTAPLQNLAATRSGIGILLLLEKYGLDISKPSRGRLSPMFCAVTNSNAGAIDLLLAHGADINRLEVTTRSALGYAALVNSSGIFSLLLERGADLKQIQSYGETPLFDVARGGNEAILALALKEPVDLNHTNFKGLKPWQAAEAANNLELVPLLHPEYLLYAGLSSENPSIVTFALERGARINISDRDGVTPLHVSISRGRPAQFRYLINSSANPSFVGAGGSLPRKKDGDSMRNQLEALRRLERRLRPDTSLSNLSHSSDADEDSVFGSLTAPSVLLGEIDQGNSPNLPGSVTGAITEDTDSMVELLLTGGAPINAKDIQGNTPLHYAVERGGLTIIEELLKKGADPEELNSNGMSPIFQAVNRKRTDIIELLLKYRPKRPVSKNLESVLITSVELGLNQAARELLRLGVPATLTDKADRELILVALSQSNFEIAEALMKAGAKLDWQSAKVQSLYSYSKKAKDTRLKEFMVRFGAPN